MTIWAPKSKQNEDWASPSLKRAFDPYGFDNTPRFDTGSFAGVWTAEPKQVETWRGA